MAPFELSATTEVFVTLAIGFAFGFVLERSGFGDSRKLAAQFYLHDMRVLKVMFTAIVTAVLLVFAGSAIGLLDFSRVWVPPTYLWPAILGGLILGVGFIVGGYCPGTSLVSASTWKIDGMFFAVGVFAGLLVFAELVPAFWHFYNQAGALGRLTLADLLGVDAGIVVLGVVLMAVGAFAFAEFVERMFDPDKRLHRPGTRERRLRRAAVGVAVGIALVTVLVGQPTAERKIAWQAEELQARLASREVFIDPAEVLGLIHNNQIQRILLDVRDAADFNVFHLRDARRVTLQRLAGDWPATIPAEAVVVVMSNDEQSAVDAWKRLAVYRNVNAYILAGGVNRWLDVYREHLPNVPGPETAAKGSDQLRHDFDRALGDRIAAARPERDVLPKRSYTAKVKVLKPVRSEGGGCG